MTVLMALALILTAAFYFLSSRTTWHAFLRDSRPR